MDIWTLFACQAIDHLKDGGYFSFIAPNSWLANAGASVFRDKILNNGEIVSFIDFGDFKVFKDAAIQTMIFVFRKGKPREKYTLKYSKINNSEIAENAVAMFLGSDRKELPEGIVNFEIEFEPVKFIGKTISFSNSAVSQTIDEIERKANYHLASEEIGNGIDVLQDFVSSRHLENIEDKSIKKGEGIFVLSPSEIRNLHLTPEEDAQLKPYYSPMEVNRYLALLENEYRIIYADADFRANIIKYPHLKSHIDRFKNVLTSAFAPYGLHRARDEEFFRGHAIFSLRKTDKPAFSYVEFPCYVSRAFLIIKPKKIDIKYLTAILNSKLSYFWFKNRGKLQGDNLQIDKEPLMNFPIKTTTDKKIEQRIVFLVDEAMKLNAELHQLDAVLEREKHDELQNKVKSVEAEIDEVVYQLYDLTKSDTGEIERGWGFK
jgi:adenine-specific DNA-methyltransferase